MEERAGSAKAVFQFDVQGSVAKSAHVGIPCRGWGRAEVAELRASLAKAIGEVDPETAGVPDFTDVKGMAILETWRTVGVLLESIEALTKTPRGPKQEGLVMSRGAGVVQRRSPVQSGNVCVQVASA